MEGQEPLLSLGRAVAAGLVAGLVSSTAVTLSMSPRAAVNPVRSGVVIARF